MPRGRVALFRKELSDDREVNAEAGKYCAHYYPNPTWSWLAVHLYKSGETNAAKLAGHYIHSINGM